MPSEKDGSDLHFWKVNFFLETPFSTKSVQKGKNTTTFGVQLGP